MTPTTPLLTVTGLVKRFGGIVVSDRIDFDLKHGEVHALIGPNGAGKTTFINLLSGEIAPNEGRIAFDGQDITRASTSSRASMGLVRSYQVTSVVQEFTALENVMLAVQARDRRNYEFTRDVRGDASLTRPARAVLEQIGLGAKQNFRVANLAHGERRQLELGMILALQPKVMLLDEPLAGMSGLEAEEMVAFLARLKGTYGIVLVEHDMDAVFALADRVTVLVYGRSIATGSPADIQQNPAVRLAYLGDEEEEAAA